MRSTSDVFLSNRVDELYEIFKRRLLERRSREFIRRLVVVPSQGLKGWLTKCLADDPDIQVAAGLHFVSLRGALETLTKWCRLEGALPTQPIFLQFHIEKILGALASQGTWEELSSHLLEKGEVEETRVIRLSRQLASLFTTYHLYGNKLLAKWEKETPSDWQHAVWKEAVGKAFRLPKDFQKSNIEIHLFGHSFIPPHPHQFFECFAKTHPVAYYLLSPCKEFWGDLLTDREALSLQKKWGGPKSSLLDEYLFTRHPLLANFGPAGRDLINRLTDHSPHFYACYRLPKQDTVLHTLQRDLLHLDLTKKSLQPDSSIQIHLTCSKIREIEVVYDQICQFLSEKKEYSPSDVVVMAPKISEYGAAIRFVFQHPKSALRCRILDLPLRQQNEEVGAFVHFLQLEKDRFSADSVAEFFGYSPVFSKLRLTEEQREKLRRWIRTSQVWWGTDKEDRIQLLQKAHGGHLTVETNGFGTWEFAFKQAMESLAFGGGELDCTDLIWFGEVVRTYRLVRAFHKLAADKKQSIGDWAHSLLQILERIFLFSEEGKRIHALLTRLTQMDLEGFFPFSSIRERLLDAIEGEQSTDRAGDLNAVTFCSLESMRGVPHPFTILIGVEEGALPRQEEPSKLNRLQGWSETRSDSDRTRFLEILLTAQERLLFTYRAYHPSGEGELPPAQLVKEVALHLKKTYHVEPVQRHTFHAYQSKEATYLPYWDTPHLERTNTPSFLTQFTYAPQKKETAERAVEVQSLLSFAKNPLREYFRQRLRLFLKEHKRRVLPKEEPFSLTPLEMSLLRRKSLEQTGDVDLPLPGPFGALAKRDVAQSLREDRLFLASCGVPPKDIDSHPLIEPLKVGRYAIYGTLDGIAREGLISWSKSPIDIWPKILIWQEMIRKKMIHSAPFLLSMASKKKTPLQIAEPQRHLTRYLAYYEDAIEKPSPLIPRWTPLIAKGEREKLQQQLDALQAGHTDFFYNKELIWALSHSNPLNADALIQTWQPVAIDLFGEFV